MTTTLTRTHTAAPVALTWIDADGTAHPFTHRCAIPTTTDPRPLRARYAITGTSEPFTYEDEHGDLYVPVGLFDPFHTDLVHVNVDDSTDMREWLHCGHCTPFPQGRVPATNEHDARDRLDAACSHMRVARLEGTSGALTLMRAGVVPAYWVAPDGTHGVIRYANEHAPAGAQTVAYDEPQRRDALLRAQGRTPLTAPTVTTLARP